MKFSHDAKRLGLKHYDVHMGMFDFTVRFVVGDYKKTVRAVNRFYGDKFYDENVDPGRGSTFYVAPYCPVVWLPRVPRTDDEHGTLAHECAHAVTRMFSWGGIPIDNSTDEVFAHAVGYLVREFRRRSKKK